MNYSTIVKFQYVHFMYPAHSGSLDIFTFMNCDANFQGMSRPPILVGFVLSGIGYLLVGPSPVIHTQR